MKNLQSLSEYVEGDGARVRAGTDTLLTEDEFVNLLGVAAPIFREGSLRPAFPTTIVNDPGVLKSRHIKVVDIGDGLHGMSGTGGTWDRIDKSVVDKLAYAMWGNIEVPYREQLASERGGFFNIAQESARALGEKLVELENKFLVDGLGPTLGLTTTSGIDTFASAGAWSTAGIFWQDILKARGRLKTNKVPTDNIALLTNPADGANAWQVFSNTATPQSSLANIEKLFPGGVYENANVDVGKAYVYAKTPTVVEYVVYQDLSVKPLPKVDEDERIRGRVIGALHVKKELGVVEISSIDA